MTAEQVMEAALDLADEDRLELVEALISTFEPADSAPFDESWHEVIRRRSAELKLGKVTSIPWSESAIKRCTSRRRRGSAGPFGRRT